MKFLLVSNSLSYITRFRLDLLKAVQAKGYDIHVAAPGGDSVSLAVLQENGITVHCADLSRSGLNPLQDFKTFRQLYSLTRRIKPDVLLTNTIKAVVYGTLAGVLAGVPKRFSLIAGLGYAFTEDGETNLKRKVVGSVAKSLYRLSLNRCQRVFFQNPDDEALFRQLGVLRHKTSSTVVNGSGVDLDFFAAQPLPDVPVFVLVARLLLDKGVREYAAAARQLKDKYPEACFTLVGDLDENPQSITRQELDAWVQDGYIDYLGKLSDVRPALAQASVMVLPSYREGTPRSVLEAMAMGRAVVTTDAPGCRETVVDGDNGFLVPVKDAAGLAAAMEKFMINPELAVRMGRCSREIAEEKYDVHKVNQQMMQGMDML